jgi:hypothetical protein
MNLEVNKMTNLHSVNVNLWLVIINSLLLIGFVLSIVRRSYSIYKKTISMGIFGILIQTFLLLSFKTENHYSYINGWLLFANIILLGVFLISFIEKSYDLYRKDITSGFFLILCQLVLLLV